MMCSRAKFHALMDIVPSDDWHIDAGYPVDQVIDNFETILDEASSMDTGFIVLEHDLWQQTVDVAVGYILPYVSFYSTLYH